ncbi:MAG: hypothetical protein CME61_00380 [Halobacteriovoraceae bacterium]|nr:hypothetical protein [Halobacteriovoraceae bacterium]|tara:strand:- start:451 stop:810 length:360 start_codon:yes stop_codon:yes gene_type:complete
MKQAALLVINELRKIKASGLRRPSEYFENLSMADLDGVDRKIIFLPSGLSTVLRDSEHRWASLFAARRRDLHEMEDFHAMILNAIEKVMDRLEEGALLEHCTTGSNRFIIIDLSAKNKP